LKRKKERGGPGPLNFKAWRKGRAVFILPREGEGKKTAPSAKSGKKERRGDTPYWLGGR